MNWQPPYADPNANPYVASQMQQMSTQRKQQQSVGMNNFPARLDSFAVGEEHPYRASHLEGQWQWDKDAPKAPRQTPSHVLNQGEAGNGTRSYHQGQARDSLENPANIEGRTRPQEQDMDIGHEDNTSPLTFGGLDKKFFDEIMKLIKEQNDAEDAENARHREKIIEINTRYQEKLSALRAQHINRRDEFLHKESQMRLHQYQQAGISRYPDPGFQDAPGYGGTPVAAIRGDAHQGYATGQIESHREPSQFAGGRPQGTEARVLYPEGRVYNNSSRYYQGQ